MQFLTYINNAYHQHQTLYVFSIALIVMVVLYMYISRNNEHYYVLCSKSGTAVKIGDNFYYIVRSDEYISRGLHMPASAHDANQTPPNPEMD